MKSIIFMITCLACYTLSYPNKTSYYINYPFPFVNQAAWGARPPRSTTSLNTPVPYVVIHHTYIPPVCLTRAQCEANMRSMQQTHMDTNGWADIGYNFAVGGEGSVYEGRSWQAVGAHAVGYNVQSIGIVLIGNFISQVPGAIQLQTTKELIAAGVRLGFIGPDYKLITHRQVTATECPGDALYNEIATWDHFSLGSSDYPFQFVNRAAWGARPPRSTTSLNTPVPYVVIHHTYIPPVCLTRAQCEANTRSMQQTHMDTNGWADIGYNFAVGGEGSVYEGRSWQAVGAHTVGYNVQSIGIVLIGNFISQVPEARQLETTKELIAAGVRLGFIRPDYKLITHRQAAATECPGDALYNEVATWDRFSLV